MKKVLIIGASGSLGTVVTEEIRKQEGVAITLFVRNNKNINSGNIKIIEGDALHYNDVKNAIAGQDICTLILPEIWMP